MPSEKEMYCKLEKMAKYMRKDLRKNSITKKCEKDVVNPISIHQKKTTESRKFHFVDVEAKRNP